MLRSILNKLYRIVIMRIYSDSTVIMMELKNHVNAISPALIKEVTSSNIEDALSFQSKAQVKTFRSFLREGNKGFYGYLNGHCVHRSWVVLGPAKVFLHKFYSVILKENEVFIQYCETAPGARGKNIFAHVLAYIGSEFHSRRVLISADTYNSSSIKSMIKAGFVEIQRWRIKMIIGKRFVINEFK